MIDFLVAWAEQIVVALIIIVIFEMIIPNSSNKKYLKVIFGIFIVYIIISPIVSENSSNLINNMIKDVGNIKDIEQSSINLNQVDIINGTFNEVYKENLTENIIETLKLKGFDIDVEQIEVEDNNILSLTIKINGEIDTNSNTEKENDNSVNENVNASINKVNEIKIEEIQISENNVSEESENTEAVENNESIITFLSETYNIDKNNITVVRE